MPSLMFLMFAVFPSSETATQQQSWDRYFLALCWVESRCNDNAVGAHGEIGRAQILRAYWVDSHPTSGRYEDCKRASYTEGVVWRYAAYYEMRALVNRDWKTLAMMHHGGRGWRTKDRAELERYWARVQKAMNDNTIQRRTRR